MPAALTLFGAMTSQIFGGFHTYKIATA
jgi:hypothetical protein